MKTYSVKPTEVTRAWHLIDASEATLGRVSTVVANLLTGKGKPMFTHHIDSGDYVVIVNADNLQVTGDKKQKKIYYRHSGFPGGIRSKSLEEMIEKDASEVVTKAVRGMLPVNKLRKGRLARLKVYNGSEHANEAQKPVALSLKKEGTK
ncbi:50S ribosomal protein L13 [soil metagenome]